MKNLVLHHTSLDENRTQYTEDAKSRIKLKVKPWKCFIYTIILLSNLISSNGVLTHHRGDHLPRPLSQELAPGPPQPAHHHWPAGHLHLIFHPIT